MILYRNLVQKKNNIIIILHLQFNAFSETIIMTNDPRFNKYSLASEYEKILEHFVLNILCQLRKENQMSFYIHFPPK